MRLRRSWGSMNLSMKADVVIDRSEHDSVPGNYLIDRLGLASAHIALLAAWVAMCGSLFFSEVLGWRPCLLCWYQRILMYPLAVLLAIGIIRRDRGVYAYVLPFSIAGIGVSLYHHLLIKTDWFSTPACVVDVPCTVDYLNWFGFMTIPFLALTAFVIITGMMIVGLWLQPAQASDDDAVVFAADEPPPVPAPLLDTANLTAGMIIVSVVLLFMVASTFV
jgi:disulfide bond formation protein DsbB